VIQVDERTPYPEERGPSREHPEPVPGDAPERRAEGDDEERGSLDTGSPPGVHPNSEQPDPRVLEKREGAKPDGEEPDG
jgi:hypothetical protein